MSDAHQTVDAVWKLESAKIIGGLARMVHDVGLAEELAQDALVAALEQWPQSGVPDNPGAWLMTTAKRRAVDHIRRAQRLEEKKQQLAQERPVQTDQDDILRLMFISCHPILPTQARVALTLRLVGGLTAAEIGRAFLVAEPVVTQRIAVAKRTLAEEQVPFELPDGAELAERLSSVLEVIYLIFNEGYSATSGDDLVRPGLVMEALRLGRLLADLSPHEPEAHGLVALMEIQASRTAARTGPSGEPVRLHEQNRGRWDQLLIRRGFTAMLRAREISATRIGGPGPYVLQAAIAVMHAQARTAADTDWAQIAALYELLVRLVPTAIVRLNQAVAVGMARGPAEGLALADALLTDPALRDYHLLPGVRADLLVRLERYGEARLEFERAATLTHNEAERAFLRRRAAELVAEPEHPAPRPPGPEASDRASGRVFGEAAQGFLARADLDPATVRSYGQTMRALTRGLGEHLPLAQLTPDLVTRVFTTAWPTAAPATWNRHRAAVRSFADWAGLGDLTTGLARRTQPPATTAHLDPATLDRIWNLPATPREHALWRLLHESAAPVSTILRLNVEDLDLEDRRARAGEDRVTWRSGAARLLPALVADRTAGPVFLAERRPGPGRTPAPGDLCPHTGRGRLSYERAEYLFKQATKALDPEGFTLRMLRPRGRV
ncbi:RNA polymerase subunit sigma [Nonomuraea sp. NBC_01738]|nr:RNA polymerase subunit sigma [Nonomuraea sp. NBC_01738]